MIDFSNNGKTSKEIREEINKRWEELGLTAGLDGYIKDNMAELFESQSSHKIEDVWLPTLAKVDDYTIKWINKDEFDQIINGKQ